MPSSALTAEVIQWTHFWVEMWWQREVLPEWPGFGFAESAAPLAAPPDVSIIVVPDVEAGSAAGATDASSAFWLPT